MNIAQLCYRYAAGSTIRMHSIRELDLAYRNVNYLAQSSLIKEEKPLEEKYPKCMSITHYGINTIERKEEEIAKLQHDIRFNFLPSYMNTILGITESLQSLLTSTLSNLLDRMSLIRILS